MRSRRTSAATVHSLVSAFLFDLERHRNPWILENVELDFVEVADPAGLDEGSGHPQRDGRILQTHPAAPWMGMDDPQEIIVALFQQYVHCSTTRDGSDTDLAEQIVRRNTGDLRSFAADKDYDKQSLHKGLRELGIRPLIKHRIFTAYDHAHNPESTIPATISAL